MNFRLMLTLIFASAGCNSPESIFPYEPQESKYNKDVDTDTALNDKVASKTDLFDNKDIFEPKEPLTSELEIKIKNLADRIQKRVERRVRIRPEDFRREVNDSFKSDPDLTFKYLIKKINSDDSFYSINSIKLLFELYGDNGIDQVLFAPKESKLRTSRVYSYLDPYQIRTSKMESRFNVRFDKIKKAIKNKSTPKKSTYKIIRDAYREQNAPRLEIEMNLIILGEKCDQSSMLMIIMLYEKLRSEHGRHKNSEIKQLIGTKCSQNIGKSKTIRNLLSSLNNMDLSAALLSLELIDFDYSLFPFLAKSFIMRNVGSATTNRYRDAINLSVKDTMPIVLSIKEYYQKTSDSEVFNLFQGIRSKEELISRTLKFNKFELINSRNVNPLKRNQTYSEILNSKIQLFLININKEGLSCFQFDSSAEIDQNISKCNKIELFKNLHSINLKHLSNDNIDLIFENYQKMNIDAKEHLLRSFRGKNNQINPYLISRLINLFVNTKNERIKSEIILIFEGIRRTRVPHREHTLNLNKTYELPKEPLVDIVDRNVILLLRNGVKHNKVKFAQLAFEIEDYKFLCQMIRSEVQKIRSIAIDAALHIKGDNLLNEKDIRYLWSRGHRDSISLMYKYLGESKTLEIISDPEILIKYSRAIVRAFTYSTDYQERYFYYNLKYLSLFTKLMIESISLMKENCSYKLECEKLFKLKTAREVRDSFYKKRYRGPLCKQECSDRDRREILFKVSIDQLGLKNSDTFHIIELMDNSITDIRHRIFTRMERDYDEVSYYKVASMDENVASLRLVGLKPFNKRQDYLNKNTGLFKEIENILLKENNELNATRRIERIRSDMPSDIEMLILKHLNTPNLGLRFAIVSSIKNYGSIISSQKIMEQFSREHNYQIRREIAVALNANPDAKAVDTIKNLIALETDPEVKSILESGLRFSVEKSKSRSIWYPGYDYFNNNAR